MSATVSMMACDVLADACAATGTGSQRSTTTHSYVTADARMNLNSMTAPAVDNDVITAKTYCCRSDRCSAKRPLACIRCSSRCGRQRSDGTGRSCSWPVTPARCRCTQVRWRWRSLAVRRSSLLCTSGENMTSHTTRVLSTDYMTMHMYIHV